MSCNLTGRCSPPGSRHQYLRGLYRYDLSIHAVVPHALATGTCRDSFKETAGRTQVHVSQKVVRFRHTASRREQAHSRRLKTQYTTQIGISVRIGIGCAPASRQPCREDNSKRTRLTFTLLNENLRSKARRHESDSKSTRRRHGRRLIAGGDLQVVQIDDRTDDQANKMLDASAPRPPSNASRMCRALPHSAGRDPSRGCSRV
jgi:hypothetical protein